MKKVCVPATVLLKHMIGLIAKFRSADLTSQAATISFRSCSGSMSV